MKIALLGASGNVGSRIMAEALHREHPVTALVRHPDKITSQAHLKIHGIDANDVAALAQILEGHDAVVDAMRFLDVDPNKLIDSVRRAGVKRFMVVGGAGSLKDKEGIRFVDSPLFPKEYKEYTTLILAGCEFLELLRTIKDLDWTFVSPAANLHAGKRTGEFRLGNDELLLDKNGQPGEISYEDYAVAFIDELEKPHHIRRRFTVSY